ncbi:rho GTPase-activating protein 12 [Exaiptasia diaphana]|uniref:Rho GTPase activating protein n=1 Tax=Exaiptasia diaphana TaxID=2652724 RepID=A0A913XEV1_EXADI|nr:rho GTPase-activating protein 12 [Exaiptasia diaphana]
MAMVDGEVEALYAYSYDAGDGRKVTFDAGEKFTLLSKANDDWWHVQRNGEKPMYVPANYVRELELPPEGKQMEDDKLVRMTGRSNSTPTKSVSDNNGVYDNDDSSVFKDDEVIQSTTWNSEQPKLLSPGIRSLAKSLQNTGVPLRGSISSKGNERPKSQSLPGGWVTAKDEESGRPYYYNSKTNETSWKPPRVSRFIFEQENVPNGWHVKTGDSPDELLYYNQENDDVWGRLSDDEGKTYYYKLDGSETAWELPQMQSSYRQSFEALDVTSQRRAKSPSMSERKAKSRSLLPMGRSSGSVSRYFPPSSDNFELGTPSFHRRTDSCVSEESLSDAEENWPPPPPDEYVMVNKTIQAETAEKQALFNRKKIANSGNKKIKRPSWSTTFVALFSSNLVFYKDQKSAQPRTGLPHGKPESSCDLRGATLEWAPSSATRKRNAFQCSAVSGLQFVLQTDNQSLSIEWFNAVGNRIKRLNEEDSSVVGSVQEKAISDDNKSNIKDKLLKFITRRPTIDELEKKGILKEQTFGCPIQHLCDREKVTVPNFVTSCIQAIEQRGLTFDGLYRVCGNVSLVQRIRISTDQEEPIQLGVKPFDDVHALTGSLKLYFRELPEPLVPFDFFSGFVEAIKQNSKNAKLGALKSLVGQLPKVNYETLKMLLGHLSKVEHESESNRMHAQNLAIVWGPNMMRPRYEAANMAMNMVYQNQIVEFLLLEYTEIFK